MPGGWDGGLWDLELWDSSDSGAVLLSPGWRHTAWFPAGGRHLLWQPVFGISTSTEVKTLLDLVLDAIEAEADGSIWQAGMFEPGMWDFCELFNGVLVRLEES